MFLGVYAICACVGVSVGARYICLSGSDCERSSVGVNERVVYKLKHVRTEIGTKKI